MNYQRELSVLTNSQLKDFIRTYEGVKLESLKTEDFDLIIAFIDELEIRTKYNIKIVPANKTEKKDLESIKVLQKRINIIRAKAFFDEEEGSGSMSKKLKMKIFNKFGAK